MKYLVNFQVKLAKKDGKKELYRSTYTILESEIDKSLVDASSIYTNLSDIKK